MEKDGSKESDQMSDEGSEGKEKGKKDPSQSKKKITGAYMIKTQLVFTLTLMCSTHWIFSSFSSLLFKEFEALHGEVSIYIWFAVTPCVYLLAR